MQGTIVKLVLLLFELICLGTMMGPLFVDEWLHQGDEISWSGSLTEISDDSDKWEGEQYLKLQDEYCDQYNSGNYTYGDGTYALCTTFTNLYGGGIAYILLNSLTMALWLFNFVLLNLIFWKEDSRSRNLAVRILRVLMNLFLLVGYIAWMGSSKSNFEGLCDDLYDGDSQGEACAGAGAEFGLATLLFNVCYTPIFIVVIFKKWYVNKEPSPRPPAEHIRIEMNSVSSPQASSAQPMQPYEYRTPLPPPPFHPIQYDPATMGEVAIGYPVEQAPSNK
jgi:hypothetical protein